MTSRDRLLLSCRGLPVNRPPVWLMRQAGRHLPEYRQLRARHEFSSLLATPALAVEAALQPLARYPVDAAIVFSDILVALAPMGVTVDYREGGPVVTPPVGSREDFSRLARVHPGSAFDCVGVSVRTLVERLHPQRGVIGFAGAPFTLAAYLVGAGSEGRHRDRWGLKVLASRDPELYHDIASSIAEVVTGLLAVQVEAGADVVMLFDTWAGDLSPESYRELALPYSRMIIEAIAPLGVPAILYLRNAAGLMVDAAGSGCDVLGIDSSIGLAEARSRLDAGTGLQGNFDPALLFAPEGAIRAAVRSGIEASRGGGYIANLGQGVLPETPVEGVGAFVRAVTEAAA